MEERDIKKAVEYVFKNYEQRPPGGGRFKASRGCITYGHISDDNFFANCGSEDCESCKMASDSINQVVKDMNFKWYEQDDL